MIGPRIILDEAAFRDLVAGKVISVGDVKIILDDIGWNRQLCALIDALAGPLKLPPDPPEAREFLPPRRKR